MALENLNGIQTYNGVPLADLNETQKAALRAEVGEAEYTRLANDVQNGLAGTGTPNEDGFVSTGATTTPVASTTPTEATAATAEIDRLQAEIDKVQADIDANDKQIEVLNEEIAKLAAEVEEDVKKATAKIEDITKDQAQLIDKTVLDLTAALKRGEIDESQFNSQLAGKLGNAGFDSEIVAQMSNIMSANTKISAIEMLAGQVSVLRAANAAHETNKTGLCDQLEVAKNPPPPAPEPERCDPIGFMMDGNRYDFFVDTDQNDQLTDANEFLGAKDNWAEMEALNTDGDSKVSAEEMAAANLKVVVTGPNGQTVMNAADLFKEQGLNAIDLASYKEGAAANQGVAGFESADGKNQLLGTFDVTKGAETITGYNTLDSTEWLESTYEFSSGAALPAGDNVTEINPQVGEINEEQRAAWGEHAELIIKLREMVQDAMIQMNFSAEAIATITELSYEGAQADRDSIVSGINEKIEAQKTADEAATPAADETDGTTGTTEPKVGDKNDQGQVAVEGPDGAIIWQDVV